MGAVESVFFMGTSESEVEPATLVQLHADGLGKAMKDATSVWAPYYSWDPR